MNLNSKNLIRFEEEEESPKELPENPMEKMVSGWQFDKKFIEQRKIFLWGVVDDKSAKDITARLLYLEAIDPGKEITFYINSPGGVVTSGMVIYDTMQMIRDNWTHYRQLYSVSENTFRNDFALSIDIYN